jgi:hypothetical protein
VLIVNDRNKGRQKQGTIKKAMRIAILALFIEHHDLLLVGELKTKKKS